MDGLKGRVAYITGGTKGIGYGIAEVLLKYGMKVAISGRKLADAQDAARKLSVDGNALGIESDVKNLEDEEKAIDQTVKRYGKVDVIIANAGMGHFAPVDELTSEQWNDMLDTNLTGVFHTLKAGVEELKKSEGYYITIASLAGANFFEKGSGYNASKFGVVGFTQAAMLDLRKYNIKVSTIMPGSVATFFNNHQPNEKDDWKIQPEDIGELVADLLRMNPRTLPSKVEVRPSKPQ